MGVHQVDDLEMHLRGCDTDEGGVYGPSAYPCGALAYLLTNTYPDPFLPNDQLSLKQSDKMLVQSMRASGCQAYEDGTYGPVTKKS